MFAIFDFWIIAILAEMRGPGVECYSLEGMEGIVQRVLTHSESEAADSNIYNTATITPSKLSDVYEELEESRFRTQGTMRCR